MALKKDGDNPAKLSRRQFLKGVSTTLGGASLASLVTGCNPPETSPAPTSTQPTSEKPATTTKPTTPQATQPTTRASSSPTLLPVPGSTVKVAADRLYSLEHIWVLPGGGEATLGITDKMQALLEVISKLMLEPAGKTIVRNDSFGVIEGLKLTTDLIAPVSGTIIAVNPVVTMVSETEPGPLHLDPYGEGWMITVRLAKPEELQELMSAEEYVALAAKMTEVPVVGEH